MKDFRDSCLELEQFRQHPPFPLRYDQIEWYKEQIKKFQDHKYRAEIEKETAEQFLRDVRVKALHVTIHHDPSNFGSQKRYLAIDEAHKQISINTFSARRCSVIIKLLKNILNNNRKFTNS
jgi:hypothetical protein